MCPDVADKADSGTKGSIAVRALKSSNNRRACFCSIGFAEQSFLFRLAYPGLFIGLSSLPDHAAPGALLSCWFSQEPLLITKAVRENWKESL